MSKNSVLEEIKALKWACRRGMLELDLIFSQFLDKSFESLSEEDRAHFKALLASTDQDLFAWIMGDIPAQNPEWQPLIKKIRETINLAN